MRVRNCSMAALIGAVAISLFGFSDIAAAQQKAGAQNKHAACLAKARAENPAREAGMARQAAYNRCMGR